MDVFFIHGIAEELKNELVGGFITKIFQINRTDLLFRFRRQGRESQLLISTHPDFSRLHLTEKKYPNPSTPPRFCTYLRKHITGARIGDVSQVPFERVVRIVLQKKMDAGLVREMVLVSELLGKAGNVLLVEGERILDCLHFRKAEEGHPRPALPGLPYSFPAPRLHLPEMDPGKQAETASPESANFLPPLLSREVQFISRGEADTSKDIEALLDRYERADFAPRIYTHLDGKKVLAPFPLKTFESAREEIFPSMNQAADAYYYETVMARQVNERRQSVVRRLKQLISRLEKRRENLAADRAKLEHDLKLKELGDLLVANYPKIKKGMARLETLDYRQDPPSPVVIPLDESLDAAGNVEQFFKKYKKAKRGLEFVSRRMAQTEEERAYLESVLFQTEEAADGQELEEIREELQAERILPPPRKETRRKEPKEALPVRRFRSSEGLEIYCGKNNVGNDYLLRRLARGNDFWFHAQGLPGSHVLLRVGPKEPQFVSIMEAATIAAFYSRGRGSGRMPIDYTQVKNVRKPAGARPGLVIYTHQKTILASPEKEKIEKLLNVS